MSIDDLDACSLDFTALSVDSQKGHYICGQCTVEIFTAKFLKCMIGIVGT